jgi:hypothetical protein
MPLLRHVLARKVASRTGIAIDLPGEAEVVATTMIGIITVRREPSPAGESPDGSRDVARFFSSQE